MSQRHPVWVVENHVKPCNSVAGEGGGARSPPFTTFTLTSKVAVYAPAEWADQKRFIYRLLARHDSLPVWLVADK